MRPNGEREPQPHPAKLRAYSIVRAIDSLAIKASANPNLTPEQVAELNIHATFVQILIFRGPTQIARAELSKFLSTTKSLIPDSYTE